MKKDITLLASEVEIDFNLEELLIDEEQADELAFIAFQDIFQYIKEHTAEFLDFLVEETMKLATNWVIDLDNGIIEVPSYSYELCQYDGLVA